MAKWRIIGIMTGNSMDAIDMVLSEFDGEKIRDICNYSEPYSSTQKEMMNGLRRRVCENKMTAAKLLKDALFMNAHWQYVEGVANAVNKMCEKFGLQKKQIDAIGFHGKTLDHNPPSMAAYNGEPPFTTQMGSAQLLANLTGIPVVGDFRSALLMNGYEGAPLAGPHNAHIAKTEGDGCYFNAGNTSNLAWIKDGATQICWDAGPFNEYVDSWIRLYKNEAMDTDGAYGKKGRLMPDLLQKLFDVGRAYYELLPPKSGDPAYYHTQEIFAQICAEYGNPRTDERLFCNVMRTLEIFAGYIAAYALGQTPKHIELTPNIVLFGGGWHNPVALKAFKECLSGKSAFILPEHQAHFAALAARWPQRPNVKYSDLGTFMEARLFADLARYYLEQKSWPLPELQGKQLILGNARFPFAGQVDDFLSQAARGWQK